MEEVRQHEVSRFGRPYYLMFGPKPQLPIDLLVTTQCAQQLTHTIDKYVEALYGHLKESLKFPQDSNLKETHRKKCLYGRKLGAIEL